jgi:hypothetical protein
MNRVSTCFLFLSFIFFSFNTFARVFNLRNEEKAAYFSGTISNVTVGPNIYQNESFATSYSDGVRALTGGEFGLFRSGERAALKLGFEVLIPNDVKDAAASVNNVNQYKIKSTGIIYAPKIGVDLNLLYGFNFRWLLSGSVGWSRLNYKNSYTEVLLPAGDHTVEYLADTLTWTGSTGLEFFMMDTTTAVVEIGYRSLNFSKMTYHKSVTTFSGDKNGGEEVKNLDGSPRTANFGGVFGSVSFRFYF